MTTATDRQSLIDRLNTEARHVEQGNSYGRDVLAPLFRQAVEEIEALSSSASSETRRSAVSPVLAFQAWALERSATRGAMTQDEYFLAQEAFFAAHPGQGPKSSTMAASSETQEQRSDADGKLRASAEKLARLMRDMITEQGATDEEVADSLEYALGLAQSSPVPHDPQKDEIAKKHGKALAEETDLPEHKDRFVELFAEALSDYEAQRPNHAKAAAEFQQRSIDDANFDADAQRERAERAEAVLREVVEAARPAFRGTPFRVALDKAKKLLEGCQ